MKILCCHTEEYTLLFLKTLKPIITNIKVSTDIIFLEDTSSGKNIKKNLILIKKILKI
jgi:hypothetical protein